MKAHREVSLCEPWSSAQRALEAYNLDMRQAAVHDCARICNKHSPLMAGITKKLPKNVTPRIFQGGAIATLPHTAPELAQVLVRNLHQACVTEVILAPTELRESCTQFSALVGAELAVCELAELLDEATTSNASFVEELAVADSTERINTHLHQLTEMIKGFSHEVTKVYPELPALMHHARFLKQVGLMAERSSTFMCAQLTANDPLLSPALRLKHTAEALTAAAQHCAEKAALLQRSDDPYASTKPLPGPPRIGLNRRSILGMMAKVQGHAKPGTVAVLLPSEAKRQKRVDQKLARRRMRGGGHSSEDEAEEKRVAHAAHAAYSVCAECENTFQDEAAFCSKCGSKRPDAPFAVQLVKGKAGEPPPPKYLGAGQGQDSGGDRSEAF